ncbi:MAG: hypothetical protein JXR19_10280 [Bacteroidia bacterium]
MANSNPIKLTKLAHLKGHSDAIYDFCVDQDRGLIYSAGSDGFIVRWSIDNPDIGELVLQMDEAIYSIYLSKEGEELYAGTGKGKVYQVDLKNSELERVIKRHNGGVFFIDKHGEELITGGEDGSLNIGENQKLKLSKKSLRSIAKSDKHIAIGSSDQLIYILNASLEVIARLEGHENSVFGLTFLDENLLYSCGRDAHIKLWDIWSQKALVSVPAHTYQAKTLSFNSELLLSASMDKSIKVWDADLNLLKVIDYARNQGHINSVNKVRWLNKEMFVSSSDDRTLIIWQVQLIN